MIKIIGGTRNTTHLCKTCCNGIQCKTMPESSDFTFCNIMQKKVTVHVVECVGFKPREQRLAEMKMREQALILDFDYENNPIWTKNGRKWGKRKVRIARRPRAISNPISVVQ